MSLVVANATKDGLVIVSDTKITSRYTDDNPYLEGTGKVAILNDQCAVGFAGTLSHAEDAIRKLRVGLEPHEVISQLKEISSDPDFAAAFIVGSAHSTPTISVIRDGTATESVTGWIGDHDGFEVYQRYFAATDDPAHELYADTTRFEILQMPEGCGEDAGHLYSRMFKALRAVCDSGTVESVGGFLIPVFLHKSSLSFGNYCTIFRSAPVTEEEIEKNNGTIPFGDAAMGTFAVNAAGAGHTHYSVHIDQGKLGIVFARNKDLVLKPILYRDIDEIDFASMIEKDFGGSLGVTMHHNSGNYFRKAEGQFHKSEFAIAETMITQGVRISSKQWKGTPNHSEFAYDSLLAYTQEHGTFDMPEDERKNLRYALFMRGVCRCVAANPKGGLQDFEESLSLDPLYYPSMINRVGAFIQLGQLQQATDAAEACCKAHDKYEAFDLCGRLLIESGRRDDGIKYLVKSHELATDAANSKAT